MESKIQIDIRPTGEPFIYIDFKPTDDLRDKVLGRFLYESGGVGLKPDGTRKENPVKVDLHILWYDEQSGKLQAMIEHPEGIIGLGKLDTKCPDCGADLQVELPTSNLKFIKHNC